MLGDWTDERVSLLKKLWNDDGLTASQCAKVLCVTRNAIIGKVHRLDLGKRVIVAKKSSGGNGAAGKYRGVVSAARKARAARIAPPKPVVRIKLPPADVFTPAADDIAVGAWAALPGTEPVTLEALSRTGCRWPIGEDAPFLFCGCEAAAGSSYCPTHKHRATGKGTTGERQATRSLAVVARFEVKNGFRGRQAGSELPG